ncbi:peptidylprolyl isomerase [Oxalobacteraceae bacterium CAVE-383]|nr:peptidylprolyl isomerase [Oxalobacteraceae bacterium CAVE-383]
MFEFIRTHRRLMQLLLLLLILPSFAFFGLQSYTGMRGGDDTVAKVAGQNISQQEWDAVHRQQLDRMRQMFGNQVDMKLLDTPETRRASLDNLIAQRAMLAEAQRDNLRVTDTELLERLKMILPDLFKPDGSFDKAQYQMLLGAQGRTPALYEADLMKDMALQQLNSAVQDTAFAPKTVAARMSDLNDQERVVQQVMFKNSAYAGQVKITDDMLKAYYDKSGAQFQVPEQAKIEYIVLDSAAAASQVTVSDADIKSYYEQNRQQYAGKEERRASHILIAVKKDASAADKAAAKAKADKLSAQLIANPADFAKVAKANSDDKGSAELGGDLGYFSHDGMMVKQFEDAVFQMKQGEVSQPVQSDFGYHIIQLTGIKPAQGKTLDQVKGEISDAIKSQLAAKKFGELADTFNNTVYEQGDSLKPAADKLHLKIETASNVTRSPSKTAGAAPYNNPKFLTALFTDDVIKNKHNTEAVEVAPNVLVAGRIVEYKPQSKKPFAEVQAAVRELVLQQQEAVLAQQAGEAKLAALKQKDDSTGFADQMSISRVKSQDLGADVLNAVMKADATKLPAYVGVMQPGQGYSIFRIGKVTQPATPDNARRLTEQQQVADILAQQEMLAYLDVLKERAKVKILKAADHPPKAVEDQP